MPTYCHLSCLFAAEGSFTLQWEFGTALVFIDNLKCHFSGSAFESMRQVFISYLTIKGGTEFDLGVFVTLTTNSLTCSEKVSVEMQKERGLRGPSGDRTRIECFFCLTSTHLQRGYELSANEYLCLHNFSSSDCILHPCVLFMFVLSVKSRLVKGVEQ